MYCHLDVAARQNFDTDQKGILVAGPLEYRWSAEEQRYCPCRRVGFSWSREKAGRKVSPRCARRVLARRALAPWQRMHAIAHREMRADSVGGVS